MELARNRAGNGGQTPSPLPLPQGQTMCPGPRSVLIQRPLGASCPYLPTWLVALSGSEGKHLGHLTRSWAHSHPLAGALFEGRLEALAWEQGWGAGGASRHSPSLHTPRPFIQHSHLPVLLPLSTGYEELSPPLSPSITRKLPEPNRGDSRTSFCSEEEVA